MECRTYRSEIRYGAFSSRTLPLLGGVKAGGVEATYTDGIRTIRLPLADGPTGSTKIPIDHR